MYCQSDWDEENIKNEKQTLIAWKWNIKMTLRTVQMEQKGNEKRKWFENC